MVVPEHRARRQSDLLRRARTPLVGLSRDCSARFARQEAAHAREKARRGPPRWANTALRQRVRPPGRSQERAFFMTRSCQGSMRPKTTMFDPDAMAMCCLTVELIGRLAMRATRCSCRTATAILPVEASTAANRSWSSQKNSRPLAVASVPPRAPPGPVCGNSHATLPVVTSIARRIFWFGAVGSGRVEPPQYRFSGDPLADALDEHIAVLERLHVIEPCLRDCRKWNTSSQRHVPRDRRACLRPTAPVPAPAPAVRRRRSRAPTSGD